MTIPQTFAFVLELIQEFALFSYHRIQLKLKVFYRIGALLQPVHLLGRPALSKFKLNNNSLFNSADNSLIY